MPPIVPTSPPACARRYRLVRGLAAMALVAALAACASIPPTTGQAAAWRTVERRFVPFDAMLRDLQAADIVLLGETHDNPAQHLAQDRILNALAHAGPPPVLVMEQFDLEQQASLDAIRWSPETSAARLASLRNLMGPGWDRAGYAPLLATAVRRHLRIVAANISRHALRSVAAGGFDALGAGEAERLGLTADWSDAQQALLQKEVADGHCGSLPPAAVSAIARSQRVRDAVMADRLLGARASGTVVALLGRGHVRRDLAVPLYLKHRAPRARVRAVDLAEDAGDPASGAAAAARERNEGPLGPLYHYVLFTGPAGERPGDPCDAFKTSGARPSP